MHNFSKAKSDAASAVDDFVTDRSGRMSALVRILLQNSLGSIAGLRFELRQIVGRASRCGVY
jgi:hypothetical protein